MLDQISKQIKLTVPQAHAFIHHKLKNYWEWGRGSGKSTGLAYVLRKQVVQMPRASFFLAGATYAQILSRTLPSTIEGLELFNLYQGVDYVVGRSGKSLGFEMPFQPPNQWNNIIHWSNGAIHQLVSLDNPNTGRGLNSYGGGADESAILDPEKLYNNVKTTNRAQKEIFKNCSMLGAEYYVSSTPLTKKGKWFTDMEKEALKDPSKYYFSKSNAYWNAANLRPGWFEEMHKEAPSQLLYDAEILNIRPAEITDGFYANLNANRHYYTDYDNNYLEGAIWMPKEKRMDITFDCKQDNDLDRHKPLIVSMDFGVFNSLTVAQHHKDINEYRILKSMFAKSPKLTSDLFIDQFIPYYSSHTEKVIHLYGGHDGHNKQPNSSTTLYEQIETLLRSNGWRVHTMAKRSAPMHARKYLLINAILKETDRRLPRIRINEHNNPDLIISLERAEAKEGTHGIEKVKKDEGNKSMLQQHTTHLSDAFDYPIYDLFWPAFTDNTTLLPSEMGVRLLG